MHIYAALLANGPGCDWYRGPEFSELRKLFLDYDFEVSSGKQYIAEKGWVSMDSHKKHHKNYTGSGAQKNVSRLLKKVWPDREVFI